MIKNKISYIVFIIFAICYSSCNTYTTFYGETLTAIPETANKTTMYRLDLSHQNLDSLPGSVQDLEDLRMLDLTGNVDINLENAFEKISTLNHLEVLILDSLQLKEIPKEIEKLQHLKQLSLASNPDLNLVNVIKNIDHLPLEFLNLKGNQISELPQNIVTLRLLKDLNLSYNTLTGNKNFKLLEKLPNLYSLWLDHNHLATIPNSIEGLKQIRFLYIDHNNLQKLPSSMSNMKKLWVIHAGYNDFVELPSVFTQMPSLLMVHINNNDIQQIPESYETEKYPLAGLILDNNTLSEVEKSKAKKLFKDFFLLSFEQKKP